MIDTLTKMQDLLNTMISDMEKVKNSTKWKAAAQRIRKNSIEFGKLAKQFRRESIAESKK